MSSYNDDNRYLDGEEKRPKLLRLLLFIIIVVVVLVIVISCGMRKNNTTTKKESNKNSAYLSSIKLSNASLSPAFSKNVYYYEAVADSDEVTITCGVESSSSKLEGCNEKVKLTDGEKKYDIKVVNGKNTSTYTINFKRNSSVSIDNSKITIKSAKSDDGKSYVLTANLEPANSEVNYKWYKDNKEIYDSNSSSYTVNTSGKYYVTVSSKETLKTIKSEEVEIIIDNKTDNNTNTSSSSSSSTSTNNSYILKINSISGNSSSWVSSVTLKVDVSSSNGLANTAYSFDGGKTYQESNKKTFYSNQTIIVVVRDKSGNTVKQSVTINKIDSTLPKVTIGTSSEKTSEITLTAKVTPGSTASGYKFAWYRNGTLIKNATSSTYKAKSSGKYKVKVTTGSGNSVTSAEYNYLTIAEKCPRLTALTKDKRVVPARSWIKEDVYIKVEPASNIVKYDIYVNKSGVYNMVSNEFTYYKTFDKAVAIKLSAGGLRYIKIVSYDKYGNAYTCYSDIYFINKK